jgi:hypothetical protein
MYHSGKKLHRYFPPASNHWPWAQSFRAGTGALPLPFLHLLLQDGMEAFLEQAAKL